MEEKQGMTVIGQVSKLGQYVSKKSGETFYHVLLFMAGAETLLQVDLDGKPDSKRFEPGKIVRMSIIPFEKFGHLAMKEA